MGERITVSVDDHGIADRLGLFGDAAKGALRKAMAKVGTEGRKTMRGLEPRRTGALSKATRNRALKAREGFGQLIYITGPAKVGGVHAPHLYGIFENYGTEKNVAHHYQELTAGYLDAAAPLIIDEALDALIESLDLG